MSLGFKRLIYKKDIHV